MVTQKITKKMRIGISFLTSKIARRFFFLFLIGALLPMSLFVWVSYQRVNDQLYEQSSRRLRNDAKTYGMALMDRLDYSRNLLNLLSVSTYQTVSIGGLPNFLRDQLVDHFDQIALYREDRGLTTLLGDSDVQIDDKNLKIWLHDQNNPIMHIEMIGKDNSVFLVLPSARPDTPAELLIGQPKSSYLWGVGALSVLPAMTEVAVYRENGSSLFSTSVSPGNQMPQLDIASKTSNYLQFEYTVDDEVYLASGWSLFLQSSFEAETWEIILSESRSDSMKAILEFKRLFPLIIALTLWVVLFLSLFFIRKTLAPLNALRQGTEKVGAKDFSSRVNIKSGDEFEQLANSFNKMTRQLQKQFNTLEVRSKIDRSILSSLDQSKIVPRALRMMHEFFKCRSVMLAQSIQWEQARVELTILTDFARNDIQERILVVSKSEQQLIFDSKEYKILQDTEELPSIFEGHADAKNVLILPIRFGPNSYGALIFIFDSFDIESMEDEINQARQLANQLAVALSNSRLYSDLEKLSIGTVEALARTVDAKSKWTAGHSERVAELAVKIARAMGYNTDELRSLFRAGLLHDIGKIGIPVKLLDKPGKLTDSEYEHIKTHPAIGGKILEPIEVYADIIPLIVQHHERYDGKGYPQGLAGKEIHPAARILCIADVYDALISQRPYREGWVKEKAVTFIKENKGVMFDPEVTDVLLALDV